MKSTGLDSCFDPKSRMATLASPAVVDNSGMGPPSFVRMPCSRPIRVDQSHSWACISIRISPCCCEVGLPHCPLRILVPFHLSAWAGPPQTLGVAGPPRPARRMTLLRERDSAVGMRETPFRHLWSQKGESWSISSSNSSRSARKRGGGKRRKSVFWERSRGKDWNVQECPLDDARESGPLT